MKNYLFQYLSRCIDLQQERSRGNRAGACARDWQARRRGPRPGATWASQAVSHEHPGPAPAPPCRSNCGALPNWVLQALVQLLCRTAKLAWFDSDSAKALVEEAK